MNILKRSYPLIREKQLCGRYITMEHVSGCAFYGDTMFSKHTIGFSVRQSAVEMFTVGSGTIKILMWSQMHGNESTATKAIADFFNFLKRDSDVAGVILSQCTLYIIPILNPDGAMAYTRENAKGADLNRDAQTLLQPESRALRELCDTIKPDLCFNLHDQRSIYGVGDSSKPAVISFLSPLQDEEASVTPAREKAMQLIVAMNTMLQHIIPGQVGRYNDVFNLNCMGDTFQSMGIPTLLFEAGHFKADYQRETTRELFFYALVQSLYVISENKFSAYAYEHYFKIPENKKTFFDVLIHNLPVINNSDKDNVNISLGVQYKEVLEENKVKFLPIIKGKGNLTSYYGHKTLNYKDKREINALLKDKNMRKITSLFINSYD